MYYRKMWKLENYEYYHEMVLTIDFQDFDCNIPSSSRIAVKMKDNECVATEEEAQTFCENGDFLLSLNEMLN